MQRIRLTESDLRNIVKESVRQILEGGDTMGKAVRQGGLLREYDEDKFPDWTRKEPRIDDDKLATLVDELKDEIAQVGDDEDKAFEIVRKLGKINASTLKKHPSVKGKPRNLPDSEHQHDKLVYAIKDEILPMLVDLYLEHGWDISVDMSKASEKYGASVFFRNLSSGIQNSFHGYKGDYNRIKKDGQWGGVMNAYRYGKSSEDPQYSPGAYRRKASEYAVKQSLKDDDADREIDRWHGCQESRQHLRNIVRECVSRVLESEGFDANGMASKNVWR